MPHLSQLHLEKDQINDQAKVSTFSFWASGWGTTEELWRRNQLTFLFILQPVEWEINVACHTYDKCDHISNHWQGQQSQWNNWSYQFHRGNQAHKWQGSHPQSSDDDTTKMFNSIYQGCSSSSLYSIQKVKHDGLQWHFMCASCAVEIGLLASLSIKRVQTCETWTLWITFLTF